MSTPRPLPRGPSSPTGAASSGPPSIGFGPVALACAAVIVAATLVTFWPVRSYGFLNWDDGAVMSAPAREPGDRGLAAWAFTTRYLEHYQPLGWLALDGIAGRPASPRRVHTAAVAAHAVNALLLLVLIGTLLPGGRPGDDPDARWWTAAAATVLFAVHPLRVEPVAWASALPYLLSYALVLSAILSFVSWSRHGGALRLTLSVALYAASQLVRVTAPLLPLVLPLLMPLVVSVDLRRLALRWRAAVPFLLVAAPLAALEGTARNVESLAEIGLAPRLAAALSAPARYAWRTLAPVDLSPLDVLPRTAAADWAVTGVLVIATIVALGLSWAASKRVTLAVWGAYLLLLAPVSGLLPSGLQATADRYTYGPAMALSAGLAALLLCAPSGVRRTSFVAVGAVAVLMAQLTQAQAAHWRDSIALWSRALVLNADNDVALYNLALAEIDQGRDDEARAHLERLLALVPDHAPARERLASLVADRESAAGDRAAAAGQLFTAVAAYDRALAAAPGRTATRIKRGMALAQSGEFERAVPDLEAALADGLPEPAVANALAYGWTATGRTGDAIALLRRALAASPADASLAANLARLLVTAEPPSLRAPDEALTLAAGLNDRTGGEDPRVLDTLALALDATGHRAEARAALDVAVDRARAAGDTALAAMLGQRRAALGR
jgi:tetratricopeptide (TPR) repeat protein